MGNFVRVAVDAMGGDNAPGEIIRGTVEALRQDKEIQVVLIGDQAAIGSELEKARWSGERLEVVHASEVIGTDEHPVAAIRKKKDSSIVVGLRMVHEGKVDAFVSAGNSGAVLVGGQVIVGRMKGVERAPFAGVIPTEAGFSLLLDCGANVDARPSHLVQFARMGSIYMENVLGVKHPSVGLVNIGVEEDKGNALVKETFPLLKECRDINFIGNIEARDIPAGGCDVLVCEAFTGNVVLKMYEGTAAALLRVVKKGLMANFRSKIGAFLVKDSLKKTLKDFDASRYGGAPLLGLNALVVKMHGSSKAVEVTNSILQCRQFKEQGVTEQVRRFLKETDE